jgi:selenocysteine lyase/cysteine desulfurase
MDTIYMDNAATSYPKPECVYTAVDDFNRHMGGNPGRGSSQRTLRAGAVLLEAREALAELFNVKDSSRIAFTLNITQALNLGLKGLLKPGDHVITTSMEHNAVARPLFVMQSQGIEWTRVQCAGDGSLDPHEVGKAIRPNTRLICMLHASNLCGTIMPVTEIGRIAQQNNILFMVDSAQTAGVLDIDVVRDNIDILAFTGHKSLLGPQGTGGIYLHPRILITLCYKAGPVRCPKVWNSPCACLIFWKAGRPTHLALPDLKPVLPISGNMDGKTFALMNKNLLLCFWTG